MLNVWDQWRDVASGQAGAALLVLASCVGLAWVGVWGVRRYLAGRDWPVLLGSKLVDGALFPAFLLGATLLARALWAPHHPQAIFAMWVPVCTSLAVIRLGAKVLQAALGDTPWVRALERTLSWLAWALVVLWVTGVLPELLGELERMHWKIGGSSVSIRTLLEGAVTAVAVLIGTLWVSAALEARLLKSATGDDLSLRKVISNSLRVLLLGLGWLLALSSVGIDLTVLSVLGGAVGVGIGLGLQKLAANYVSGFVILAERSMRIGDMVKVDQFEGRITDIKARYTLIRSAAGRESIVPNEMLVTQRVENLSLADPNVSQSAQVSVAYDSDVDVVMQVLVQACQAQARVLTEPAPSAVLSAFGADGLEFTVYYWIRDPENGQLNVRSAVLCAILQALRERNIDIPYPQRVLHMAQLPSQVAGLAPPAGAQAAKSL